MEPAGAPIKILERIQGSLAKLEGRAERTNELLVQHGERLDRFDRHAAVTSEPLGAMNERMAFFERIATASREGRSRLDDRVDRLDTELERLRERFDAIEPDG